MRACVTVIVFTLLDVVHFHISLRYSIFVPVGRFICHAFLNAIWGKVMLLAG